MLVGVRKFAVASKHAALGMNEIEADFAVPITRDVHIGKGPSKGLPCVLVGWQRSVIIGRRNPFGTAAFGSFVVRLKYLLRL